MNLLYKTLEEKSPKAFTAKFLENSLAISVGIARRVSPEITEDYSLKVSMDSYINKCFDLFLGEFLKEFLKGLERNSEKKSEPIHGKFSKILFFLIISGKCLVECPPETETNLWRKFYWRHLCYIYFQGAR